jgi:hypothetical protein
MLFVSQLTGSGGSNGLITQEGEEKEQRARPIRIKNA